MSTRTATAEHKRIEDALCESEERFRQIAENVQDVLWIVDAEYQNTLYVNQAFESILGRSPEGIYAQLSSFLNYVYPDDQELVARMMDQRASGVLQTHEYRILRPDGFVRWIRDRAFSIRNSEGKVYGIAGVAEDITEQKHAEEELRSYSRRLVEAQESERKRIARELHDEIGQVLSAIRINLQSLSEQTTQADLIPHIQENVDAVDEAIKQVRNLALELRPSLLDDLGLGAALRWYVNRQVHRQNLEADIRIRLASSDRRFPPEVETACFRIVQEALTNIARHARARKTFLELKQISAELRLCIEDDGVGFDMNQALMCQPSNLTLGLKGMKERALAVGGRLEITSTPGIGTQILGSFPINEPNG